MTSEESMSVLADKLTIAMLQVQHGWCSPKKASTLARLIIENEAKNIVEIGVFGGRSLIPMAIACKHQGFGVVVGIDPWEPRASVAGQTGENAAWWGKLDHEMIYNEFCRNVILLGVEDFCDIRKARSDDVTPVGPIDLLHIDGNHSDQAVSDANRFAAVVAVGGHCFMDDCKWVGGGVTRAEFVIQAMGFEKQYELDTGAMFKRVRNTGVIFP